MLAAAASTEARRCTGTESPHVATHLDEDPLASLRPMRAQGVELNPLNHAAAERRCDLMRTMHEEAGCKAFAPKRFDSNRVQFHQGDVRSLDVILREHSTLFCAIRGASSRPKIMHALLVTLTGQGSGSVRDQQEGAVDGADEVGGSVPESPVAGTGRTHRLICVGFGLDLKGKPYEPDVRLTRVLAIRKEDERCGAAALYGDVGPRCLLEYTVHAK